MLMMASAENKLIRRRLWSSYASSVLSISLVLLLVGAASLLLVNGRNFSDYFKENMQISVIFKQDVSETKARTYCAELSEKDFVKQADFVSKEQGINEMEELLGQDFLSVFDTAPIPASVNLSLKAEYVNDEGIEAFMQEISASPLVDEVVYQKTLIDALNANLSKISMLLSVFILLLLFISYVMIANTVRLNIFSKRFTIHTMRLVGATKAFIRKPFLVEALFQGVIAAELAALLLIGGMFLMKASFIEMFSIFALRQFIVVLCIMLLSGVVICETATFIVVGRVVSLSKEEIYV